MEKYFETLCLRWNVQKKDITSWKNEILRKFEAKIASLMKRKIKYAKTKSVLDRPEVLEYLQDLHSRFVLIPIDKASNDNVSFVCKRYYVEVILKEIGTLDEGSET